MPQMRRERARAVLLGQQPDRPVVDLGGRVAAYEEVCEYQAGYRKNLSENSLGTPLSGVSHLGEV